MKNMFKKTINPMWIVYGAVILLVGLFLWGVYNEGNARGFQEGMIDGYNVGESDVMGFVSDNVNWVCHNWSDAVTIEYFVERVDESCVNDFCESRCEEQVTDKGYYDYTEYLDDVRYCKINCAEPFRFSEDLQYAREIGCTKENERKKDMKYCFDGEYELSDELLSNELFIDDKRVEVNVHKGVIVTMTMDIV